MVRAAEDAALLDLGDGICCLEYRSKGNSITPTIKEFTLELLEQDLMGFDGMVIGSQRKNFSAGADLRTMLDRIEAGRYELFDESVNYFQQMTYRIKYYHKPIVAAPYGMTLGGGCETAIHAHRRVAQENVHMGLVEIGVGLLPGGGGSKEAALLLSQLYHGEDSVLFTIFDRLLCGTVTENAAHAAELGYLSPEDKVASDPALQIEQAKQGCLELVRNGVKQRTSTQVVLPGRDAYQKMLTHADQLLELGEIAPYDRVIGEKIALILAGSSQSGPESYTEQQILDTERTCFTELTKRPETKARIESLLNTGKKLRN